jgi:hypothetical protein
VFGLRYSQDNVHASAVLLFDECLSGCNKGGANDLIGFRYALYHHKLSCIRIGFDALRVDLERDIRATVLSREPEELVLPVLSDPGPEVASVFGEAEGTGLVLDKIDDLEVVDLAGEWCLSLLLTHL